MQKKLKSCQNRWLQGSARAALASQDTAPCSTACRACATACPHAASSVISRRRSAGHVGSSGRYAPHATSVLTMLTTCSSDRCSWSATTPPHASGANSALRRRESFSGMPQLSQPKSTRRLIARRRRRSWPSSVS